MYGSIQSLAQALPAQDQAESPYVPVFFATTEGQTERIANRIAWHLVQLGLRGEAIEVTSPAAAGAHWPDASGAVLCASVHHGKHQQDARRFAALHHEELSRVPSMFVSVSLAAASEKPEDQEAAEQLAVSFVEKVGWDAEIKACVAGALAYTRYNWLVRFLMKSIAKRSGGETDTSRDHEYTDWSQVEELAVRYSSLVGACGSVR